MPSPAVGICAVAGLAAAPARADTAAAAPNLSPLSIEKLASLEITSVSKRAEPVSGAPAAVYVVTLEQIRRFGAGDGFNDMELARYRGRSEVPRSVTGGVRWTL